MGNAVRRMSLLGAISGSKQLVPTKPRKQASVGTLSQGFESEMNNQGLRRLYPGCQLTNDRECRHVKFHSVTRHHVAGRRQG